MFKDSCVVATLLILSPQKQLERLPPPHQRAVAPLSVLQAALHEVPGLRRQERQGHARGAHCFLWQCPAVHLCYRSAAKLPHVSAVSGHVTPNCKGACEEDAAHLHPKVTFISQQFPHHHWWPLPCIGTYWPLWETTINIMLQNVI